MSIQSPRISAGKKSILPLPTPKTPTKHAPHTASAYQSPPARDTVTLSKGKASPTYTPKQLFVAVTNGALDKVIKILDSGISVSTKDGYGNQPIHKAAFYGYPDMIAELKNRGADVNARVRQNQQTPLHKAAYAGNIASVEKLLNLGGDIKAVDKFGNTPLHAAVSGGHTKVAALLLSRGAELEARDKEGNTPMHKAAHHGEIGAMHSLACRGGNLDQRNNLGETPIDLLLRAKPHANIKALRKAAHKASAVVPVSPTKLSEAEKSAEVSPILEKDTPLKSTIPEERAMSDEDSCVATDSESDSPKSILRPIHHTPEFNDFEDLKRLVQKSRVEQASREETDELTSNSDSVQEDARTSSPDSIAQEPPVSTGFTFSPILTQSPHDFHAFLTAHRRAQDITGKTRLHHAAAWGDIEKVAWLTDTTQLKPAFNIFVGNNELGRAFVPLGQEENAINTPDLKGNTPLHEAARNEQWDVAHFLIQNGANPFMKNQEEVVPAEIMPWPVEESSPAWPTDK